MLLLYMYNIIYMYIVKHYRNKQRFVFSERKKKKKKLTRSKIHRFFFRTSILSTSKKLHLPFKLNIPITKQLYVYAYPFPLSFIIRVNNNPPILLPFNKISTTPPTPTPLLSSSSSPITISSSYPLNKFPQPLL